MGVVAKVFPKYFKFIFLIIKIIYLIKIILSLIKKNSLFNQIKFKLMRLTF